MISPKTLSKPKIIVLGTFLMGPTTDLFATKLDNLISDTRHQEIREVVERLKEFKPTKHILLIGGGGHVEILSNFLEQSRLFELVPLKNIFIGTNFTLSLNILKMQIN